MSVGKEHFSGTYLSSTLALINAEFESCVILVTGTLQKYNIATEKKITYDQAYTFDKNIPIVALTAHQRKEYKEKAEQYGLDDFYIKPLGIEETKKVFKKFKLID